MHLHIEKIVLWPRAADSDPREIAFRSDRVNVVTGQSERGKSALLWIIDYCLGSRRCSIPVGIIREKTEWFGVVIDVGISKLLLARREPGKQIQTNAMFMTEADEIHVPTRITQNCSVADVKARLGQLAQLPSLSLNGGDDRRGFKGRPSIRDMAPFNFLPQHIVANPYTLFFKADTAEHQERLRAVFPLVLGATQASSLELKRELNEVERALERHRAQRAAHRASAKEWEGQMQSTYLRARELGLVPDDEDPSPTWSAETYLARLERVPQIANSGRMPLLLEGATEAAARELARIRQDEGENSRRLSSLRSQLSQVERLDHSTEVFQDSLELERDRLHPVSWFAEQIGTESKACPMCGSTSHDDVSVGIKHLVAASEELARSAAAVKRTGSLLDRERSELREEIRITERRLNDLRHRRTEWEGETTTARAGDRQTLAEVFRFVGRLEQALVTYRAALIDDNSGDEVRKLEARAAAIRTAIDSAAESRKIRQALDSVADTLFRYARLLGIAPEQAKARLDLTDLTLVFGDDGARLDHLWEIGSGANWMGFHIAAYLALHRHFLSQTTSPVPSFLIIDQPSQAFFPDRWPLDPDPQTGETTNAPVRSTDIERVRQIFQTLSDAVRDSSGALQLIVVDHADDITWEGVPRIHCAERWRDGDALIPGSW